MNLNISKMTMVQTPITHIDIPKVHNSAPTNMTSTDTTHISKNVDVNQKNADMEKLTTQLNQKMSDENIDISFGYNKELNKAVITVTDKNSGEVITKLPSEDAMKFAEGMKELQGKLLDKKG